jgi:hypothetical protein
MPIAFGYHCTKASISIVVGQFDNPRAYPVPGGARLNGLLKKSEQQIPRGLKAARDDKNKRLIGTTEVVPCYKALQRRLY